MSMKSLIRLNRGVSVSGKPKGWVVREYINPETKKTEIFELGMYMTEDRFLGIHLNFSIKNKLIRDNTIYSPDDKFTYYDIPSDVEFALSTFKSRKGKVFPVLIEPDEEHPAILIACVSVAGEGAKKILIAGINKSAISIKDYIDKERNCVGIIAAVQDHTVINPRIDYTFRLGVVGSTYHDKLDIVVENGTNNINIETIKTQLPNKTAFISLDRFIKKESKKGNNNKPNEDEGKN